MAPKRSRLVEDPPAPSSSSEEEEEEEGGEEEGEEEEVSTPEESSEEEDEQENKSSLLTPPPAVDKKAPTNKLVAATPSKQSSSSEDEEDGSESDSDSESDSQPQNPRSSRAVDATIKPIATKPMEETPKSKKARSKPEASVTPSPVKLSTSKRQGEIGLEKKESKRAKKKEPEPEKSGDDSKKQIFQRIWSEEDEIVFLKGIADYVAKHGCVPYPNGDMNEFHDVIRNSLHGEFSRGQLTDKIRRMKKKYENNVSRAKLGEDPTFQKPHEQKAFELSKKIWGVEGNSSQQSNKGNGKAKKNQKPKAKALKEESEVLPLINGDAKEAVRSVDEPKSEPPRKSSIISDFARLNESVGLSPTLNRAIEIGLGLLSESVKADFEDKLEEIQEEEFQLYLKKVALIQMQVKAAMHAFRSRNE